MCRDINANDVAKTLRDDLVRIIGKLGEVPKSMWKKQIEETSMAYTSFKENIDLIRED